MPMPVAICLSSLAKIDPVIARCRSLFPKTSMIIDIDRHFFTGQLNCRFTRSSLKTVQNRGAAICTKKLLMK